MYPDDLRERLARALDPAPSPVLAPGDRLAAVLLPIVVGPKPSVVLTRRAEHLSRHAGEIAFPGGLAHAEDASLADTALRETEEELGLAPAAVDVVGSLPPVHTSVSGILIVPFVGMLAERPAFRPDAGEIAEVLEYPLDALAAAESEIELPRGGHVYRGFAYEMNGDTIWGATGRILHELIDALRKEP
jgi:8-oxo-dGTP pyrophosphatase MutT (NUDIX family)